ncbi:MAG: type II toxin-antitoxin system VapC family toxin [Phycisphaerales bacterium]|nr:type II toxin-antitoxin system VapC family toxin [Phycisphaerales bacterium]
MPLDIPDGTTCFLDSTIFYYALVPTSPFSTPCLELLNRIIAGRVSAVTSVAVLSDAMHKVMISEVASLTGRDRAGLIGYLGKHPEVIARLTQYPLVAERLESVPMTILPVDQQLLGDTSRIAVQHTLLTNDATIIALMQRHNLTHLVTNDDDFDQLPGISVWKPR